MGMRHAVVVLLIFLGPVFMAFSVRAEGVNKVEVTVTNSVEASLVKAFEALRTEGLRPALTELDLVLARNPNFRLGHMVKGDLLMAQAGSPVAFADSKLSPNTVAHLRHEAQVRLERYFDAPPVDYLPAALLQLAPQHRHALLVDSERSRLYVFRNVQGRPQHVVDFYISAGKKGIDKMREGDQRTPLGIYHVTTLLPKEKLPNIDLYGPSAFPLSYPNEWDRRLGKSGSGIWIHGTPSNTYSRPPRSSDGCVVLSNDDLLTIAKYIDIGSTPVIILPRIKWVTSEQWQEERAVFNKLIGKWKKDRESANINFYLSHYSRKFNADGKDFKTWALYYRSKRVLKKGGIKVKISNLSVFDYPNESPMVMMTFDQQFKDKHKLLRTKKRQYWTFENGVWKIIHEATVT